MRFALHGPLLSGKSTIARLMQEQHAYLWLNYTDFGKTLCAQALTRLLGRYVSREEVIARKNEWREFIIAALRIYGFDQGAGVDDLLAAAAGEPRLVWDNVRYQAQYDKLKEYGFVLVRLVISPIEQERRAVAAGISRGTLEQLRADSSETPLAPQHDEVTLYVDDKTPTELAQQLLGLARLLT